MVSLAAGVPPPLTGCVVSNQMGAGGQPWQMFFHVQCLDERRMAEAEGETYLLQLFLAESRTLLLNTTSPLASFHINNIPGE